MFKKLLAGFILPLMATSSMLSAVAQIKYEIQDIDTLQTHSSAAIDINDKGQIFGCYNLDGTQGESKLFLRDSKVAV